MKTAYLLLLTFVTFASVGFLVPEAHADDANGISILNISVQPYAVKVGDIFTVTATLANNSTVPIFVSDMINNDCQGPFFTVSFDNHVKVAAAADNGRTCSYVGLQERLDPGERYTGTSPGLFFTYTATQSGIANVTVTFPYEIKNQTDPNQSNIGQTISKSFLFTISDNNTNISIPPHSKPQVTSLSTPLQQFKSGIDPYHVTCRQDLQLLIKLKDNSPACVKSTSLARLLEQGWISAYNRNDNYNNNTLQDNTVNFTSTLKLDLSTSSNTIKPGQELGITISVSNPHANPIDVPSANNWHYGNVSTGPCSTIGYGVSILDGFYDVSNVTKGKNLDLFFPGTLCPVSYETASVYEFQPSSDTVKEIKCKQIPGMSCPTETYQMGQSYKFSGYWDQGQVQPFSFGVKTLVGADEWGHVVIEHFIVSNSTIFAGNLGSMSCPLMYGGVQFSATVKNSTGFANYYNSTQYGYTFFLHPGTQGTVNVQYHSPADAAWFENNANAPLNMTNRAILSFMENVTEGKSIVSYAASLYNDETGHHSQICHYNLSSGGGFMEPCDSDNTGNIPPGELSYASNVLHVGIDTMVEPSSVMLSPNTSPVFAGTVYAKSDAMSGVYWLDLARDRCSPGVFAKLVVLP